MGSHTVNYLNEPVPYRIGTGDPRKHSTPLESHSAKCANDWRSDNAAAACVSGRQGAASDLVGAHMFAHQFNLEGPTWFCRAVVEKLRLPQRSGNGTLRTLRAAFQCAVLFGAEHGRPCPDGMSQKNCVDYLYSPSFDEFGISNGLWGLFRAYDPTMVAKKLQPLPNNPIGPNAKVQYSTCPEGSDSAGLQHQCCNRAEGPGGSQSDSRKQSEEGSDRFQRPRSRRELANRATWPDVRLQRRPGEWETEERCPDRDRSFCEPTRVTVFR